MDFNKNDINNKILNTINQKALQKSGEKVLYYLLNNYSKEGYSLNDNFTKWQPLKNPRPKPYTDNPILYKTGNMKKSFRLTYDIASFTIDNEMYYSIYHQNGTDKMPARPILYEDSNIEKIIKDCVFDELDKMFSQFKI